LQRLIRALLNKRRPVRGRRFLLASSRACHLQAEALSDAKRRVGSLEVLRCATGPACWPTAWSWRIELRRTRVGSGADRNL